MRAIFSSIILAASAESAFLNAKVVVQGRQALQEQDEAVQAAASSAFEVQLGGSDGRSRGWRTCLAARADDLSHLRSQLGHVLASQSSAQGLAPMGLVAYIEVRWRSRRPDLPELKIGVAMLTANLAEQAELGRADRVDVLSVEMHVFAENCW